MTQYPVRSPLGKLVPKESTPPHKLAAWKRAALAGNVAVIDISQIAPHDWPNAVWVREECQRQIDNMGRMESGR